MFNGALNNLLANSGDDVIKSVAKTVVNNNADDFMNSLISKAKNFNTLDDFLINNQTRMNINPSEVIKAYNDIGIPIKSADDLITLYHGTNEAGYKGITGSKSLNPFSYLATDKNASNKFAFGKGGVLEFKVPAKDVPWVKGAMAGSKGGSVQNPAKLVQGSDGVWRSEILPSEEELIQAFNKSRISQSEIPEAAKQYLQPKTNGNLMAIHNLSPDKLAFSDELGGMAMPSIGIVDPNVGIISGYGDITLVGNKNLIDPRVAANKGRVFPNDMYSPRYPGTKDIINKASEQDLVKKLTASGIDRNRLDLEDIKYFGDQKPIMQLYGKEKGIDFDSLSFKEQQSIRDGSDYQSFVNDLKKNLVESRKFKVWDSNRGREKLFDLNAENALKLMRKNSAAGGEGFNYGLGNIRASNTKPFNSVDEIINSKNRLVTSGDFEKIKTDMDNKLYGLIDELSGFRDDPSSMHNIDAVIESIGDYYKGLPDAFGYGYKSAPSKEVLSKLDKFKDEISNMATEYFEAKPNRVVGLNEFSAAVVPKNTEQYVRDILQKNGITNLVEYDAAVENARQLALQNLKDLMF